MRTFLAIAAAIGILYGIAFLVAPDFVLATYGLTTNASTVLAGRYFGATLLGLGVVVWFVRVASDGLALRGLLLGLTIQAVVGLVISIAATIGGTMNVMGWSAVLIYAALLVGYLYYLFADRTVVLG